MVERLLNPDAQKDVKLAKQSSETDMSENKEMKDFKLKKVIKFATQEELVYIAVPFDRKKIKFSDLPL